MCDEESIFLALFKALSEETCEHFPGWLLWFSSLSFFSSLSMLLNCAHNMDYRAVVKVLNEVEIFCCCSCFVIYNFSGVLSERRCGTGLLGESGVLAQHFFYMFLNEQVHKATFIGSGKCYELFFLASTVPIE